MARKRVSEKELVVTTPAAPRHKPATTRRPRRSATTEEIAVAVSGPTTDDVARLAYSYWEARGFQGGSPEEDWLRAEQELLQVRAVAATA